eukprot:TRINITY_DN1136_c0_g2_i2.p1 TRINITY_DN1136_c0_g2~~TRINITY_DN1136_c0_g2_i2.p1  ORF type:complete len:157 (-),score=29.62 TRINITY_DN1136_c0_g2_i2:144-614(-)
MTEWWFRIVARTKQSRTYFAAFGAVCVVVPWAAAKLTQYATNPMTEEEVASRRRELSRGRADGAVMSRVNKERLGVLLGEIQRHDDTEDRYKAALRGETLTGAVGARVRGGGGTSLPKGEQPPPRTENPPPSSTSVSISPPSTPVASSPVRETGKL